MVRAGFRALLDATTDIDVVGEAATGGEALEQVRALRPDAVVMDIRMPEMDGLEATRRITTDPELSQTRVLVLTTFELDEYVFGALDAGASGFLPVSDARAHSPAMSGIREPVRLAWTLPADS